MIWIAATVISIWAAWVTYKLADSDRCNKRTGWYWVRRK